MSFSTPSRLTSVLTLACALSVGACVATSSATHESSGELPADWRSSSTLRFEALVKQLAGRRPGFWCASERSELGRALDGPGEVALRAAVLLAHSDGDDDRSLLIKRLERRVPSPTRAHDAVDVVAAAALERASALSPGLDGPNTMALRLAALASGTHPHPDLEVRVECARVALTSGVDSVTPFLIRVLRAGTPAERQDRGDWEPSTTLTWSKHRAAQALSQRAHVPCRFRPDGSWQHQMDEAQRLETLLLGKRP